MKPRRNDKRVIELAASVAHLPTAGFFVSVDHDIIIVNHPESMKWPNETRRAIEDAVEALTKMKAWVT